MDMEELVQRARDKGWQVTRTNGGHVQFKGPGEKGLVHTSGTPSDPRTMENLKAQLRREGLDLTPEPTRGTIASEVDRVVQSDPDKAWAVDDIVIRVRARHPGARVETVHNILSLRANSGKYRRVSKGVYRLEKPPVVIGPTPIDLPPTVIPAEPPVIDALPAVDDQDEADIDAALDALAKVADLVRKHKLIRRQLAELKRLMAGL